MNWVTISVPPSQKKDTASPCTSCYSSMDAGEALFGKKKKCCKKYKKKGNACKNCPKTFA